MSANAKMVLIPLERYEELTKKGGKVSEESKNTDKDIQETKESKTTCDGVTEEDILSFLPTEGIRKAKLILRHMKSNQISWDECGRLVWGNECVVDSNVIEVIRDAVSNQKPTIDSTASKQFYKLLILTRFPISLLRADDGSTHS
jgi:hypothetical protein